MMHDIMAPSKVKVHLHPTEPGLGHKGQKDSETTSFRSSLSLQLYNPRENLSRRRGVRMGSDEWPSETRPANGSPEEEHPSRRSAEHRQRNWGGLKEGKGEFAAKTRNVFRGV